MLNRFGAFLILIAYIAIFAIMVFLASDGLNYLFDDLNIIATSAILVVLMFLRLNIVIFAFVLVGIYSYFV